MAFSSQHGLVVGSESHPSRAVVDDVQIEGDASGPVEAPIGRVKAEPCEREIRRRQKLRGVRGRRRRRLRERRERRQDEPYERRE